MPRVKLFNRFAHSAGPGREPHRVEAVGGRRRWLDGKIEGGRCEVGSEKGAAARQEGREQREKSAERRDKREERPPEAARGPAMKPPEGNQPFRAPYRHHKGAEKREERREKREERREKRPQKRPPEVPK